MREQNLLSELLLTIIGNDLLSENDVSRNIVTSLRKALLYMIFLHQDDATPSRKIFIDGLLSKFSALLIGLTDYTLPITGAHSFKIVQDDDGKIQVTLPRGYIAEIENRIETAERFDLLIPPAAVHLIFKHYKTPIFEWGIITKRHVGFFDFMGFKNIVTEFENNYSDLHRIIAEIISEIKNTERIYVRPDKSNKHAQVLSHEDGPSGQLKFVQFSDTILIFTYDDSQASLTALQMASLILFSKTLSYGYPIRGALASGEVVADFDKNIFFGQPIIDAYMLEEKQQWYGVAFHQSITHSLIDEELENLRDMKDEDLPISITVEVPTKTGHKNDETKWEKMEVLNWPIMSRIIGDAKKLISHFEHRDNKKLNSYYLNTLKFIDESSNFK